jgi:hypothetical protein
MREISNASTMNGHLQKYCDMTPESRSETSIARQWLGDHVSITTNSIEYIIA